MPRTRARGSYWVSAWGATLRAAIRCVHHRRTLWHDALRVISRGFARETRSRSEAGPKPEARSMSALPRVPLWLWLVAVPLALIGLAWGLLAVLLPPARATQLVRDQLARSLARDVRFEHVGLSLWPPVRLSVRHLELAEPGGFDHRSAFSSAALDLDVETLALELGRSELAFSGLVDSLGPRARFALQARGTNLDLEQVLGWISAADARAVKGLSGHGQVAFDLTLRGSVASGALPVVTG